MGRSALEPLRSGKALSENRIQDRKHPVSSACQLCLRGTEADSGSLGDS